MPFARGLFLRQESPISRKTFPSKNVRQRIRLNYKPLTRQESPISRKTFPSKNVRQRIRLNYKPPTRQKLPISRKTFLLKKCKAKDSSQIQASYTPRATHLTKNIPLKKMQGEGSVSIISLLHAKSLQSHEKHSPQKM